MAEKIKQLKNLAIAYKCALEYDNCPGIEEVNDIIENLFDLDKKELTEILSEYEGYSPNDISVRVFKIINSL